MNSMSSNKQQLVDDAREEFEEIGTLTVFTYIALNNIGVDAELFLYGLQAAS